MISRAMTKQFGAIPALAVMVSLFLAVSAFAQDDIPSNLEVKLKSSRTLMISGVTNVVAMSEELCAIDVTATRVRFTGLKQGETLIFLWVGETRHELLVTVASPTAEDNRPVFNDTPSERELGHGIVSSGAQFSVGTHADTAVTHNDVVQWSQKVGPDQFRFNMESLGSSLPGMSPVQVTRATLDYATRGWHLQLLDSPFNLNGPMENQLRTGSVYSQLTLRGLQFSLERGTNTYEVFGGAISSPSFLRIGGAPGIGGFTVRRKLSDQLSVFSMSAVTDQAPALFTPGNQERRLAFVQMFGGTYRPNNKWAFNAEGAGSSQGMMGEVGAEYFTLRRSFYIRAKDSSGSFPLETMNLVAFKGQSFTTTYTERLSQALSFAGNFQHVSTPLPGKPNLVSDFATATMSSYFSSRAQVSTVYTKTRVDDGINSTSSQRGIFSVSSRLTNAVSNTGEVEYTQFRDAAGQNSQGDLALLDSVSLSLGRNTLFASYRYERTNASLLTRLFANVGLLPPDARDAFLRDPQQFLSSPLLTPELRDLFGQLLPTQSELRLTGQFALGRRLTVNPYVAWNREQSSGPFYNDLSAGYSLSYQLTRRLTLRSSVQKAMAWDPLTQQVRQNTVFLIGFVRQLSSSSPLPLISEWQHASISGQVFDDLARTGVAVDDNHGVAGLTVELDNGQKTTTDDHGRYRFASIRPGHYRVRMPLSQFSAAIRVTTPTEIDVDITTTHFAQINFGVVRVAGVTGLVFNDYLMNGVRQHDALPMGAVGVIATSGATQHSTITGADGIFHIENLPAGDYALSLDPAMVPPGYMIPAAGEAIHLAQAGSVYREIPLKAMRSVAGHVLLRQAVKESADTPADAPKRPAFAVAPIAGVRIVAGDVFAISDEDGSFLLRGLPAGEVSITVEPSDSVPPEIKIPSWKLQMPREPIEMRDVNIVIQTPELAKLIASSARPGKTPPPSATTPSVPGAPGLSTPAAGGSRLDQPKRDRDRDR